MKASPFLKRGMTRASFRELGKIPVLRDWFRVSDNGRDKCSPTSFNNFIERSSLPVLVLGLNFVITDNTSASVTLRKENSDSITLFRKFEKHK